MRKVMVLGLVVALCGYAFGEVKVTPITTTKPAPATKPTATQAATAPAKLEPFLEIINTMPETLMPEEKENQARAGLRYKWLSKKCFDNTGVFSFSGKMLNVAAGSDGVYLTVDLGERKVAGMTLKSVIVAGEVEVAAEKAAGWKVGQELILSGRLIGGDPPEFDLKARKMTINLQNASVKEADSSKRTGK